nr:alcohol dehydrogenase 1-like isoform X1 [Nicotiana tomentosiformis]
MSSIVGKVIHCKGTTFVSLHFLYIICYGMGARQTITDQGSGDGTSKKKMEVRLKILYAFLRYTDIYFWEAKEQNSVFPRILGHEASVYVISID